MTDQQLLELAAKAAGIDVYESNDGTIQNRPVFVFLAGGGMGTMPYEERWNPLNDDAQALRLAVKLSFIVDTHGLYVRVSLPFSDCLALEKHDNDLYAATRRAIVRAAAAIGKEMK